MDNRTFQEWRSYARSVIAEAAWERRKESVQCMKNIEYHYAAINGVRIMAGGQFFMFCILAFAPSTMAVRAMMLLSVCAMIFRLVPFHKEQIRENWNAYFEFYASAKGMTRLAYHIDGYAGYIIRDAPLYKLVELIKKEKLDLQAGLCKNKNLYDDHDKPEPVVGRLFELWTGFCDNDD